MGFLLRKPSLLVILILSLSLIGVGLWGNAQHNRAEGLQKQLETAAAQVEALSTTLISKDGVIKQFEDAAEETRAIIADQKQSIEKAASRVRALKADLAETRHQLQLLEEADYAITECAALLGADLNVCPGHASGLLQRAYGGLQGPSGDGTATGPSADRPAPDK